MSASSQKSPVLSKYQTISVRPWRFCVASDGPEANRSAVVNAPIFSRDGNWWEKGKKRSREVSEFNCRNFDSGGL